MKNSQYTFRLLSALVWVTPFALTGCLSSGEANFGEDADPPYNVGEGPSELDDYENNGGTPGEEFTDGGGYNEETPGGGAGDESSDEGGEGSGEEGGAAHNIMLCRGRDTEVGGAGRHLSPRPLGRGGGAGAS